MENEIRKKSTDIHPQANTIHCYSRRRLLSKTKVLLLIVMLFVILNTIYSAYYEFSKKSITPLATKGAQGKSSANKSSPMGGNATYYKLTNNTKYHYEFRFEQSNVTNNNTRLMILFNGTTRTCLDYWTFTVGRRILHLIRSFHFSILVICSTKKTFDRTSSVQKNADVKWIYTCLQKWINEVYFEKFRYYPRLYIHGISRGSSISGLLCRILPIQHQILTIYPGEQYGLLTPSDYPINLQRRLQLDSVFANWFYFDFCYKPTLTNSTLSEFCPFQSERRYYQPVPPSYFIHLQNDQVHHESEFTATINSIHKDSFLLGGKLLSHTGAVKLYVVRPLNVTPTYMQENFDIWYSKPYASAFFYQHYVNQSRYKTLNRTHQTCRCASTDYRYYRHYPNITKTWSKQKQDEYQEYVRDVTRHRITFCEDICGDIYAEHSMSSRNLDKALEWVNKIDKLRHSLLVEDYLSRPLRIWMYNKTSIVTNNTYFTSKKADFVNISREFHMYSPEYYLQDYFQRLQASKNFSRHNLQWAQNPLLADYFIIPSDFTYYYFYPDINQMSRVEFEILEKQLNREYFGTLLTKIRTKFPYWSMATREDQFGSNHILTILTGRNMGILFNETRKLLKNVIQIVFTGFRQDLLPPDAPPPRDFRGTPIIYRHGYDVVIPQFIRPLVNSNRSGNSSDWVKNKKRLLFFAGVISHTINMQGARPRIHQLFHQVKKGKYNMTIQMKDKRYDAITVIDGHQKPHEYADSMQSTVFTMCPEGYFSWSPRFYDAIRLRTIPLVLADNIVLPFERFVDWPSISAKINVSNIGNMIDLIQRIDNFEQYVTQKLINAQPYVDAFHWPYSDVRKKGHTKHDFLPDEDKNGTTRNAFHYVSLELRCRRLEQMYGLTSDVYSSRSKDAQKQACSAHAVVCPCYDRTRSVALRQYF